MSSHEKNQTSRRGFLGSVATGAAAMGIATLTGPLQQLHASHHPSHNPNPDDPEQVFKDLKGKHRIVFDVTEPKGMMPFAWPRIFLMTNEATGTAAKDNSVVVILRHNGIPFAFEDRLWTKYKFGELFNVKDDETKSPVTRNAFWKPAKGTYKVPGVGVVEIGINELQDSGVHFVVCNAAMTVFSAICADQMKMDAAEVKKDWEAGLLPGITIVPSGVWAVGRAQEHGCAYCFAG
ncbi:MAG TPA: twin-arginine translocation signal domain-containing protein [Chitinophagaceae bacterium]|nr:twin-arginine translocation signal domain-containing protein [Chitinophagaceae bacterium]